jgi:hypothetical protein
MPADRVGREPEQLGVAPGQSVLRDADVVRQPRADRVRAAGERPFHHGGLVAADAGRGPGRVGENVPELSVKDVEQVLLGRKRVLHSNGSDNIDHYRKPNRLPHPHAQTSLHDREGEAQGA